MVDLDAIAKRLDRRDGFHVVSYQEVGLPLYRLNCSLTLHETTDLGAIEEFVLRSVSQGVNTVLDLERFLGLPTRIVSQQIGQLMYEGRLFETPEKPGQYQLSSGGVRYLSNATSSQLIKHQMPLYFDGITRKLVSVEPGELWSGAQLSDAGVATVAPSPSRAPKASEIDVGGINRTIAVTASIDQPARRVVRLDAVVGRPVVFFRRALATAFKSQDGRRISVGFAIDGRASEEHEVDYERSGAAEKAKLFAPLFDSDKRRREIQAVARELKEDVGPIAPEKPASGKPSLLRLKPRTESYSIPAAKVRVLGVYEHAPLLKAALENARSRLLLVSPWIRANVVNDQFVKSLSNCLSRGVDVVIAYGIGKKDPGEKPNDRRAREALEALEKSFSNFRLVHRGNTHAKVLLVDSTYFVTTSFNWLSFRGDPNQPMREEEGTLVEDSVAVDAYYERLLGRINAASCP